MDDCNSCQIFSALDALAQGYGRDAFEAIAPATKLAFDAFVGAWVAWVLIYHAIIRGDLAFQMLVPRLMVFTLCTAALNSVDLYWEWLYQPTYDAMNQVATTLVVKSSTGIDVRDLSGMLGVVETQIVRVLAITRVIWSDAGLTGIGLIFAALVLAIPFVFVWGIFLAFVLEGVFKLLAITAIAPLLIAAAAFQSTRGFAISGARIVLGGVLTVVFAAVAMGFTLTVLDQFLSKIPFGQDGISASMKDWVLSPDYWGTFLLGFISILFHLKAATLAANISGASDGPGAAAAVVAGGMTALAAVKGATMKMADAGRDRIGRAAGAVGTWNRDRIWGRSGAASAPTRPGGN